MKIELTTLEAHAAVTSLYVAKENALLELNLARQQQRQPAVLEYMQARFTALDKIHETLVAQSGE